MFKLFTDIVILPFILGMVTAFCRQLGWKNMEMLISQFQDRLHFGIHSELLDLMKLPSLNGMRARTLFDSGFESISSIASADANTIENILHKSVPFQSEKEREDDDSGDIRKRNRIKSIWITGYCGITTKEAAENLIKEARKHLSLEIGVSEIKWDSKSAAPSGCLESTKNRDINNSLTEVITLKDKETEKKNISQPKDTQTSFTKINATNKILDTNPQVVKEQDNSKKNNSANISNDSQTKKSITKALSLDKNEFSKTNVNISKDIGNGSANSSPCLSNDIIWDSLNFTEAGLDNLTKLRTSDKMFSPNISFGEIEEKPAVSETINKSDVLSSCTHNSMSTKDISLFSSDGDNSSLFEESLPIDLIPSKLLDKEPTVLLRQETASDYANINSNTILNAFKSTLVETEGDDDDENEDIKLIYEDDNVIEREVAKFENNRIAARYLAKKNLVACKRRKNSYKEMQPVIKKKKEDFTKRDDVKIKFKDRIFILPKINGPLSKHFSLEFNKYKMDCYVLRGNDIIENLDVIQSVETASLHLLLKKMNLASNEIIGSHIMDIQKSVRKVVEGNFDCPIKGLVMYLNQGTSIFVDFTSLDNVQVLKDSLRNWFQKKALNLKMLCSKTMNVYIKRWLGVNLSTNCIDISLIEWLIDSSEKIPNVDYLVSVCPCFFLLQFCSVFIIQTEICILD